MYTASALAAGGKLFNTVFGIDYHIALAIGAGVILCYTFMGGFMAVYVTDFVQGTLIADRSSCCTAGCLFYASGKSGWIC